MISIIIRTKNEERWIGRCLRMIFKQSHKDFEVVLVDNSSTDHTLQIARRFPIKIINIDKFAPGLAINEGIRASKGDYLVCLSAHCIPKDEHWLKNLLQNFQQHPNIAGVYGRQLPFLYSSDNDKRDLLITFGLDHRIQKKDHFFHNANSMFRRDVWQKFPFDESATNIEDRIWGKTVIDAGYHIAYEPEAPVYHFHGIHQDRNEKRAQSIVRIMESLDNINPDEYIPEGFRPDSLSMIAFLPVQGDVVSIGGTDLIERTLLAISECKFKLKTVVVSDDVEVGKLCARFGVTHIARDSEMNAPDAGLDVVLKNALTKMESGDTYFDAVMYVNYLYPFRPERFVDRLVSEFCHTGADTVLSSQPDYLPYWAESNGALVRKEAAFMPRSRQSPTQRGLAGLGLITSSEFIRRGQVLGDRVALLPLENPLYSIKAGDKFSNNLISVAFEKGAHYFGVENEHT